MSVEMHGRLVAVWGEQVRLILRSGRVIAGLLTAADWEICEIDGGRAVVRFDQVAAVEREGSST